VAWDVALPYSGGSSNRGEFGEAQRLDHYLQPDVSDDSLVAIIRLAY
jgi:hypothetical protein